MTMILAIICILVFMTLFLWLYPPFGGKTSLAIKLKSKNFKNGKFVNEISTPMTISMSAMVSIVRDHLRPSPDRMPRNKLNPRNLSNDDLIGATESMRRIIWFGHSAFLLQLEGKNILLDPMFSKSPSPFQAIGPKRFSDRLPLEVESLPDIDIVLISHDHYDHLDYDSIKKISNKTTMFFVPIGLKSHLIKWGVDDGRISEMDWWDEEEINGIKLVCTPARHFSGRTLTDRFATLWCSWAIVTSKTKVYFSGDTGYGPHFKNIGKKYGPFDLTLLECGQYDSRWPNVHMSPEQTVGANNDLRGRRLIPMHWGAFALALHDWTDPVERILKKSLSYKATVLTPEIGEIIDLADDSYISNKWWRNL